MSVFLHLFHGRDDPNKDMDDWGYSGPTLGPLRYVHTTYMSDVKFAMEREAFKKFFPEVFAEWDAKGYCNAVGDYDPETDSYWIDHHITTTEGLVFFQGKYYGDFSVTSDP